MKRLLPLLLAAILAWIVPCCLIPERYSAYQTCGKNINAEQRVYDAPPDQKKESNNCASFSDQANMATQKTAASKESAQKKIYLTFDDGPTDSTTPKVLNILKEKHVKATFFVIGKQIGGREKILQREKKEGHAIGIHTYTHVYKKIYSSPTALLADIQRCKEAIKKVLPGFETTLYRFPGGSFNLKEALIKAVEEAGYRHYDWNASAEDAADPNTPADVLFNNAVTSAGRKNRVILLLHDGVGYRETIKCLPAIIDYFREKGYRFETL